MSSSSRQKNNSSRAQRRRSCDRSPTHVCLWFVCAYRSRTFVSIVGGCCCGILGLTNWSGFLFYLLTAMLTSVVLAAKAGFNLGTLKSFFVSLSTLTTDGLVAGCMSYVLFWTLLYDIVYVY